MLPIRLRRVNGHEGRENDVLFHPARQKPPMPETLVYFGGDVQDYEEVMQTHRDNRNYVKWSLENTARMLSENFPTKHIVVVRPARIEYKSFSCYDNFVPSNNAGVPDHTPTHHALHHLEKLLQELSIRVKELPTRQLTDAVMCGLYADDDVDIEEQGASNNENKSKSNGAAKCDAAAGTSLEHKQSPLWWRDTLTLDKSKLSLVGFSKGCVVLNQLIYEFHYTKTLTPWDRHMCSNRAACACACACADVRVHVHVSPYQVADAARPWIGREERAFTSLLHKLGAKIDRYLHDDSTSPHSLNTHFEVLSNFKAVQDSRPGDMHDASEDDT
ncbi:UPF0565 protein C2orf69 homolog [Zerene cesonia]|uniref:UPF0565 protein C2orf69 homolog n=1 Tax=Zerene cesonia TaxID=33412 RepID=UPI0018E51CCA|nr:UPF0565 protein C2orf69 homolog [Zerene cesonia]